MIGTLPISGVITRYGGGRVNEHTYNILTNAGEILEEVPALLKGSLPDLTGVLLDYVRAPDEGVEETEGELTIVDTSDDISDSTMANAVAMIVQERVEAELEGRVQVKLGKYSKKTFDLRIRVKFPSGTLSWSICAHDNPDLVMESIQRVLAECHKYES